MKTRIIFILMALFTFNGLNAQTNDLTEEIKQKISDFAKQRVDQFNDQLSFIAGKKKYGDDEKDKFIRQALKNFIGGGNDYKDEETGVIIKAPIMEVSRINRRTGSVTVRRLPIKVFLNNIKNLRYSEIQVTSACFYYPFEVNKVSDNKYDVGLIKLQLFVGKSEDKYICAEGQYKMVKIIMDSNPLIQINDKIIPNVLLGDVSVKAKF